MATFCYECVAGNRKMKKLAYFPRYWLDLAQLWRRGYFWILNPKSTIKFLFDVILTSKLREGKTAHISLTENAYYVIMMSPLVQFFENVTYLLLMTDYPDTKFGLIWSKESKVMEGSGIRPPPPPG